MQSHLSYSYEVFIGSFIASVGSFKEWKLTGKIRTSNGGDI
jgi:hypothetical protein